jgi:2-pyrone-4,6-dicarboxylate lactonase
MADREGSEEDIARDIPRMKKRDWIFDLHVDPEDFLEHEKFVRALPLVTVIDHMARVRPANGLDQPAFRLLLELLKDDRYWVTVLFASTGTVKAKVGGTSC